MTLDGVGDLLGAALDVVSSAPQPDHQIPLALITMLGGLGAAAVAGLFGIIVAVIQRGRSTNGSSSVPKVTAYERALTRLDVDPSKVQTGYEPFHELRFTHDDDED